MENVKTVVRKRIKTTNDGKILLEIWIKESNFTKMRFKKRTEGEQVVYKLRKFDYEKGTFEQLDGYIDGDGISENEYEEYFDTVEEAEKKAEEIIKEIARQDKKLLEKYTYQQKEIVIITNAEQQQIKEKPY